MALLFWSLLPLKGWGSDGCLGLFKGGHPSRAQGRIVELYERILWNEDASYRSESRIDPKRLKEIRDYYFTRAEEDELSEESHRLINRFLKGEADLLPSSDFLIEKGAMAKNYDVEVALTRRFIEEYSKWKASLLGASRIEKGFSKEELSLIDVTFYARLILYMGRFNPLEVQNLSLVVDDLYGSHLYEWGIRSDSRVLPIEINHLGDFLSLRRYLALVQSIHISTFDYKKLYKETQDLPEEVQIERTITPLTLKEEGRVRLVRKIDEILNYVISKVDIAKAYLFGADKNIPVIHEVASIIRDIFKVVEPATPVDPIAGNLAKKYLEEPWMPKLLTRFRRKLRAFEMRLERLSDHSELLNRTVLDIALDAASGDIERAVVLVGLMGIQRKALIRSLATHYKEAGTFDEFVIPLIETVSIYYYITDLAETLDQNKARLGRLDSRYSFLYPNEFQFMAGFNPRDNKFYHFWSEAFTAYYLRKRGHPTWSVEWALSNVGRVYEAMTSIAGINMFRGFGMNPVRAFLSTKMGSDISLHVKGARFGSTLFEKAKSEDKVHYEEPRKWILLKEVGSPFKGITYYDERAPYSRLNSIHAGKTFQFLEEVSTSLKKEGAKVEEANVRYVITSYGGGLFQRDQSGALSLVRFSEKTRFRVVAVDRGSEFSPRVEKVTVWLEEIKEE